MANEYKRIMHARCGRGGLFCPCCNHFKGKDKSILSKLVRRTLKRIDMRDVSA